MHVPIPTLHLFPMLDEHLIVRLRSLTKEDWDRPTLARQWTVKDVAAHLLDGNLRTISRVRDGYSGLNPTTKQAASYTGVVQFLNQLNADWVNAYKRISPNLLIGLLESSAEEYIACLKKLDPFAPADFPVAWAGQKVSPNWFHVAREYTEKWHHQQQIHEAIGSPGILSQELFFPVLDTFMQALPFTYRHLNVPPGTSVSIHVAGQAVGSWHLVYREQQWNPTPLRPPAPTAELTLDPATAWKLFTRAISRNEATKTATISGDPRLVEPVLNLVAVTA